jgi:hypothetical protein
MEKKGACRRALFHAAVAATQGLIITLGQTETWLVQVPSVRTQSSYGVNILRELPLNYLRYFMMGQPTAAINGSAVHSRAGSARGLPGHIANS